MFLFMKEFFKDVINDNVIRFGFSSSLAVICINFIVVLFYYKNLPPFIPIFNQMPWGEQRLGSTTAMFMPVFTASLVLVCNFIVAKFIYKNIPLAARMLAITSLLASILIFIFILKTVFELT